MCLAGSHLYGNDVIYFWNASSSALPNRPYPYWHGCCGFVCVCVRHVWEYGFALGMDRAGLQHLYPVIYHDETHLHVCVCHSLVTLPLIWMWNCHVLGKRRSNLSIVSQSLKIHSLTSFTCTHITLITYLWPCQCKETKINRQDATPDSCASANIFITVALMGTDDVMLVRYSISATSYSCFVYIRAHKGSNHWRW